MQRVATFMVVKEGKEEEYREAHRNVWPEILEGIKRAAERESINLPYPIHTVRLRQLANGEPL